MSIASEGKRQNARSICNVQNNTINNTTCAINTFSIFTFFGQYIGIGGCLVMWHLEYEASYGKRHLLWQYSWAMIILFSFQEIFIVLKGEKSNLMHDLWFYALEMLFLKRYWGISYRLSFEVDHFKAQPVLHMHSFCIRGQSTRDEK